MSPRCALLLALVAGIAAGCAPIPVAVAPAPEEVGTAVPAAAPLEYLEREVRYYRDESGALWDDRGRRVP